MPSASGAGHSFTVGGAGNLQRTRPVSAGGLLLTTPAHAGEVDLWGGNLAVVHTNYFWFGVLSKTTLGIAESGSSSTPYEHVPEGTVRVSSLLPDGSASVKSLSFGGNSQLSSSSNQTLQLNNQLSWFSADNQHTLKVTSSLARDAFTTDLTPSALGSFAFNSLADLEAGQPSSFTRTLAKNTRSGSQLTGAASLGDYWRPSPNVQVQYGVRVDANRFLSTPAFNQAVADTFGVRNDVVPNRAYVSPRVGLQWYYGSSPQVSYAPGSARPPHAVIHAGIGLFQNMAPAQLISSAVATTGLASSTQTVTCVGAAVPFPDWNAFLTDPGIDPGSVRRRIERLRVLDVRAERHAVRSTLPPTTVAPRGWRLVQRHSRQSVRARPSRNCIGGARSAGHGRRQLQPERAILARERGRASNLRRPERDRSDDGGRFDGGVARIDRLSTRLGGAVEPASQLAPADRESQTRHCGRAAQMGLQLHAARRQREGLGLHEHGGQSARQLLGTAPDRRQTHAHASVERLPDLRHRLCERRRANGVRPAVHADDRRRRKRRRAGERPRVRVRSGEDRRFGDGLGDAIAARDGHVVRARLSRAAAERPRRPGKLPGAVDRARRSAGEVQSAEDRAPEARDRPVHGAEPVRPRRRGAPWPRRRSRLGPEHRPRSESLVRSRLRSSARSSSSTT